MLQYFQAKTIPITIILLKNFINNFDISIVGFLGVPDRLDSSQTIALAALGSTVYTDYFTVNSLFFKLFECIDLFFPCRSV